MGGALASPATTAYNILGIYIAAYIITDNFSRLEDEDDNDEYYVFTPGMTITDKDRSTVKIIDDHNDDDDDDDCNHDYLKLVSVSNKNSTNQK